MGIREAPFDYGRRGVKEDLEDLEGQSTAFSGKKLAAFRRTSSSVDSATPRSR